MTGTKPLVYWDSDVWTAFIMGEERKPGEMEGVIESAKLIYSGGARLLASVLVKAEVLEGDLSPEQRARFVNFLKRRTTILVDSDLRIMELAGRIRDYYREQQ